MRLLICASILLVGCAESDNAPKPVSLIQVSGYLQDKSLDEASGLARSYNDKGLLWAINDDGPAVLHALDTSGRDRGKVGISKVNNRDWEDLASFTLDDKAYLVVADIGDNEAKRKDVSLYIVEEPDPDDKKVKVEWRIDFTYPGGPRDAEAIAVDATNGRILILSKRDIPAALYELPLRPDSKDRIIATKLGLIDSLPQPSRRDVSTALRLKEWYWQPTSMDISADGSSMLVLTYRGVYYFNRRDEESWVDALLRPPLGLPLGKYKNAESIAFGSGGSTAFVTTEKKHAPLLRIDVSGVMTAEDPVTSTKKGQPGGWPFCFAVANF